MYSLLIYTVYCLWMHPNEILRSVFFLMQSWVSSDYYAICCPNESDLDPPGIQPNKRSLTSWSKIFFKIYLLIYSLVPVVCPCLYHHSLLRLNQNRIGFMAKSSTSALDKCRQFSFFIAAVFRWNQCIWRVWVYIFFLLHLC